FELFQFEKSCGVTGSKIFPGRLRMVKVFDPQSSRRVIQQRGMASKRKFVLPKQFEQSGQMVGRSAGSIHKKIGIFNQSEIIFIDPRTVGLVPNQILTIANAPYQMPYIS